VSAPTRATIDGRAYLDLRNLARDNQRPVDELLQLYILEAFLIANQLLVENGSVEDALTQRHSLQWVSGSSRRRIRL
jgi:hypothetical protein